MPSVRATGYGLRPAAAVAACLMGGCALLPEPPAQVTPDVAETYSLFGAPLRSLPQEGAARDTLERRLAAARAAHERDPADPDALIWLGRRNAYLGRFRAAVAIFSEGIEKHPRDARFLRHRGHRYITLRRFTSAIQDLEAAAARVKGQPDQVEPDGLPNSRNIPTSTLQSNVWYHLGLAYYLTGGYQDALRAYQECLAVSRNPDMLCATTYWLHRALSRAGREREAALVLEPIRADLDVIENHDYLRLLLMERGEARPDTLLASARREGGVRFATVGYGVATWRLARGEADSARALLGEVVRAGNWPAFGHIAAEADLHRMGFAP